MPQNVLLGEKEPRLASNSGNVTQAILATLPLLGLFVYFLYEAAIRPNQPIYALGDVDDEAAIADAWDQTPPMIPLFDMMIVFLSFYGLFAIFLAYMLIFIPRRRKLLRSYLERGETCLGDVTFDDKTSAICSAQNARYGEAVYAYPNEVHWTVRKRVRLFQHYSRERVTIARLSNRPFSGQPKSDLQIDLQASKAAIPKVRQLTCLVLVWVLFTLFSPLFLIHQMTKLYNDDYEDAKKAFKIYLIVGVAAIPVFSLVVVILRWTLYRHWLVNRGWLTKTEGEHEYGMGAQDEGVVSVFVSELVGRQNPEEVSYYESEDAFEPVQGSSGSYVSMNTN
jgi:hypothetical protein